MPATSRAMQQLFAIAAHHPEELHKENKRLLGMPKSKLHEFAATSTKDLPARAKSALKKRKGA